MGTPIPRFSSDSSLSYVRSKVDASTLVCVAEFEVGRAPHSIRFDAYLSGLDARRKQSLHDGRKPDVLYPGLAGVEASTTAMLDMRNRILAPIARCQIVIFWTLEPPHQHPISLPLTVAQKGWPLVLPLLPPIMDRDSRHILQPTFNRPIFVSVKH